MIVCWEGLFATAIEEGDSTAPVSDKPTIRPNGFGDRPTLIISFAEWRFDKLWVVPEDVTETNSGHLVAGERVCGHAKRYCGRFIRRRRDWKRGSERRMSILPGGGDATADLVEPIGHEVQLVQGGFLLRVCHLEHSETFPVGMKVESLG